MEESKKCSWSSKGQSWKLLESCGVQIITFTTTQLILLVERKYPLTRFTLEQMLNNVRLEVEEESEVSLELLRDTLRLDDAEGIDYLPSEEIFTELARMGYEKPSTKLIFYKGVGKGCSGVETPLFKGMIVAPQAGAANVNVVLTAIDKPFMSSPTPPTQPPPSQDHPSTSQVQPTPPPSLIAQPPSPQQQQPQPS
nr:hypothetical protein [Tanacetum cinerariifolium]